MSSISLAVSGLKLDLEGLIDKVTQPEVMQWVAIVIVVIVFLWAIKNSQKFFPV